MSDDLTGWIGRTQRLEDEVTRPAVRRLAAMLDLPAEGWEAGTEIPQMWYATLFGPMAPKSRIAADGHPEKGDFLPPVPLPRRMFAGRRMSFHAPLRVGDAVERISEITGIESKTGKSGAITFVTVVHRLNVGGRVAVTEEHDIVYRTAPQPGAPPPAPAPASELPEPRWRREVTPDAVMLFRYSALTFNAHRIHYDADYTRRVEGYPDRVVNGGLTAMLLTELARASLGRPFAKVTTRNAKPLFVDRPITLCGHPGGDWWALDPDGALALKARVEC